MVVEFTSSNGFPTAILVLHGASGETLRRAGFVIKKELEGLDGVDQVIAAGLEDAQLHVDFDPARVAAAGLSPLQVADAWRPGSATPLAGRVRVQDREWLVRMEGKTPDPEALA